MALDAKNLQGPTIRLVDNATAHHSDLLVRMLNSPAVTCRSVGKTQAKIVEIDGETWRVDYTMSGEEEASVTSAGLVEKVGDGKGLESYGSASTR